MLALKQKNILWILTLFVFVLAGSTVYGKADLTPVLEKNLDVLPLDVASSEDGSLVFILSRGELILYASKKDEIIHRSAIDNQYDSMTYSGKNKTLILTSSSSGRLKIIQVEQIYDILLSGLPFKGPFDAPVTIAVFDDYQ